MILLGAALTGFLPGEESDEEHAQRERSEREPGLQSVVLEHHLQVDRKRDHHSAEGDLLERLRRDAEPEVLRAEELRVDQRGLALALTSHQPPRERAETDRTGCEQHSDRRAPFLPDENPEDDPAHADRRQDRADDVDPPVACVRDIAHPSAPDEHDRDDHDLSCERDPPGEVRRDEATD